MRNVMMYVWEGEYWLMEVISTAAIDFSGERIYHYSLLENFPED